MFDLFLLKDSLVLFDAVDQLVSPILVFTILRNWESTPLWYHLSIKLKYIPFYKRLTWWITARNKGLLFRPTHHWQGQRNLVIPHWRRLETNMEKPLLQFYWDGVYRKIMFVFLSPVNCPELKKMPAYLTLICLMRRWVSWMDWKRGSGLADLKYRSLGMASYIWAWG